jgi:hypothetical protein
MIIWRINIKRNGVLGKFVFKMRWLQASCSLLLFRGDLSVPATVASIPEIGGEAPSSGYSNPHPITTSTLLFYPSSNLYPLLITSPIAPNNTKFKSITKTMDTNYPILDSHIHLFPASELTTLAWAEPSNPLYKQHSLDEYTTATASASSSLEGFIFLETDRINDLAAGEKDGSGWTHPLQEVSWLKRIALGLPREGEGHTEEHAKLCKAIVPWAPVPSGAEVLERYVERVREEAGEAWGKVKGFRFLVQDKARGTMLEEKFVEGVRWLGRKGLVFDLGVDLHSGGRWQLEEAAEMMERVHDGVSEEEKVTVVISELRCFILVYGEGAPARFLKDIAN